MVWGGLVKLVEARLMPSWSGGGIGSVVYNGELKRPGERGEVIAVVVTHTHTHTHTHTLCVPRHTHNAQQAVAESHGPADREIA